MKKVTNYMSSRKVMIFPLIFGLKKSISFHKISYYPELDSHGRNKIKAELYMSNYVTKADSKGATSVDISHLEAKSDLTRLKAGVDKIDIDKLNTLQADLRKLCSVADNDVAKKPCIISWSQKLMLLILVN